MAGMKYRILLFLPLVVFLVIFCVFIQKGRPGAWHAHCRQSWQEQKWWELRGLARSLQRLDTPDAEVEYFAALAAARLNDQPAAAGLSSQWLHRRALNWNWERDLAELVSPKSLIEKLSFLRARAATAILLILVVFNALSFRRPGFAILSCTLSCAGIALLLL